MAGSVTWIDDADSAVQYALGDVINDPSTTTITGGHTIASGYVKSGAATGSLSEQIKTQLKLGSFIDGTPTEQWLSVTPLTAGSNIYGGISWREIS